MNPRGSRRVEVNGFNRVIEEAISRPPHLEQARSRARDRHNSRLNERR